MTELTGRVLKNRYRIDAYIGRGGMAEVYKAYDTRRSYPVAIKFMHADLAEDVEFLRRFRREAESLSQLAHENIVRFYEFEREGHLAFLVMDYVEGITLRRRILEAEGPMPLEEALGITRQVCAALHYAHEEGLIHRDVKPGNIMIRADGQVLVTDFGIAKAADAASVTTYMPGTPAYMSPEQCRGEVVDRRSDIYSLGIVVYEMLTGRRPFAGDLAPETVTGSTRERIRWEQVHAVPPPLRQFNPGLPWQTEDVVRRALAKEREGRWLSALAFWEALAASVSDAVITAQQPAAHLAQASWQPEPLPAEPPRSIPEASKPASAHLLPVWMPITGVLAVVGAAMLMLVGIFALGQRLAVRESAATSAVEVIPTATLTATPVLALPVLSGTPLPHPVAAISLQNVDRVTLLARWGKGKVAQVTSSPDGRLLAVASSVGVYLYSIPTLAEVSFTGTDTWIGTVAFSPDGTTLASGSWDSMVRLWRISDGKLLRTLAGHKGYVESVAFSPDGVMLASGSTDKTVRLWQVSDGKLLRTLEDHTDWVNSVAFSPDGATLASGSTDKTVRLWQVSDGKLLRTLEGLGDVDFSPDGATLASGGRDGTVRLWRVDDGELLRTLVGHSGGKDSLAFSPDGATLVSASEDDTIQLWQVSDGTLLHTLEGHADWINSLAFAPDGATLASGAVEGDVRLWQVSDGTLLRTLESDAGWVVAFSPDGAMLASGSKDGTVWLWRVSDGTLLRTLEGHKDGVRSVAFTPDGATLASGALDNTVLLWRVSDGALLRTLEEHADGVTSVAFSPDGAILASGAGDKTVRLWRVSDGTLLRTLEGHTDAVQSVAFSPDGTTLASGSFDTTARLWQVSDGRLLHTLGGHLHWVFSVAFSPDGTMLASGSADKTVRLWGVADGTPLRILEGHPSLVSTVAFAPGGGMLASGGLDGTIRLWGVR